MKNLNNKNYCKQICKDCGASIIFSNSELRTNKEYVLEAIKNCEIAFFYADGQIKQDCQFVLECIKICPKIALYLSKNFLSDFLWLEKAVNQNSNVFKYLCEVEPNISKNKNLCLLASTCHENINLFSKEVFLDQDFLKELVERNPLSIDIVISNVESHSIKEKLSLLAIEQNIFAFRLIPEQMKKDKIFIQKAIAINYNIKDYMTNEGTFQNFILGNI